MGCLTSLDSTLPYEENNNHSLLGADQNVFALEIAFLSVAGGARRPDMLGPLNSCLCQSFSQTSGITPNSFLLCWWKQIGCNTLEILHWLDTVFIVYWFLHLWNGDDDSICFRVVLRLKILRWKILYMYIFEYIYIYRIYMYIYYIYTPYIYYIFFTTMPAHSKHYHVLTMFIIFEIYLILAFSNSNYCVLECSISLRP